MEGKKIEESEFKKLVGIWKTEGLILKTDINPEMKISGTDSYEIILDGYFMLHTADVLMGDERNKTHEIIGFGNGDKEAQFQYYNNEGLTGEMKGTINNGHLKINGDRLRFIGDFSNNDSQINGSWEKWNDQNKWVVFLIMNFNKINQQPYTK